MSIYCKLPKYYIYNQCQGSWRVELQAKKPCSNCALKTLRDMEKYARVCKRDASGKLPDLLSQATEIKNGYMQKASKLCAFSKWISGVDQNQRQIEILFSTIAEYNQEAQDMRLPPIHTREEFREISEQVTSMKEIISSHEDLLKEASKYKTPEKSLAPIPPPVAEFHGPADLIEKVLRDPNVEGIAIGEFHFYQNGRRFLIEFMPQFKRLGVDLLFIEGFEYEKCQTALDDYFFASDKEPLPKVLLKTIEEMGNPYLVKKVLIEAKRQGIHCVCLDTKASIAGLAEPLYDASGKEIKYTLKEWIQKRQMIMNFQAMHIMKIYKRACKPSKYLTFTGAGHTTSLNHYPGLSHLFQIPSLSVEDSNDSDPSWKAGFNPQKGKGNGREMPPCTYAVVAGVPEAKEHRSLGLEAIS